MLTSIYITYLEGLVCDLNANHQIVKCVKAFASPVVNLAVKYLLVSDGKKSFRFVKLQINEINFLQ